MLKKFFHPVLVVSLLAMGLAAAACSDSNDEGPKSVELTGGTSTSQTVWADETQKPENITFKAAAPWTATVADTTPVQAKTKAETGNIEWLKLDRYSGGAGDVSLTMTLEVNTTGHDRKAEIRIVCGGTTLIITVEQKGTTESGEVPEDPDKPEPAAEPIELSGETPTQQTVYADETLAPAPIKFTATGPWTAAVAEVAVKAEAGRVGWLALSTYNGEAGYVSLTMTLSPNYTGQDRKAEIRITCSDKTVVLTVEQKATKADGTLPEDPDKPAQPDLKNRIKRIEQDVFGRKSVIEFTYDELGRLIEILDTGYYYGDPTTTKFTYGDKTVAYESICKRDGSVVYQENGSIELDENGRGVSGTCKSIDESGTWDYTDRFTYDANGQLVKTEETKKIYDKEGKEWNHKNLYTTTWTNGNPTKVLWGTSDKPENVDEAIYGTIENRTNLDLNWLLVLDTEGWDFSVGGNDFFAAMGYMGKRPKNMAQSVTTTSPGFSPFTYEYQLDSEGRIAKIIANVSTFENPNEYTIHYAE